MNALHINGNDLALEAVREVADAHHRRAVLLSPDAREAVDRARAVVDALVAGNQLAYAITTGVGKLSDVRIAGDQIRELQVNLVRSHAVGVGEPLPIAETRAMMLLRANSLAKGYSGMRAVVIDTLCEMLNRGVTPFVPSQGSVGASGDLAPLAHLALALIGEGECLDEKGARIASSEALKRVQIKPLVLEAKEAVSLINGTQAMLAVGTLALLAAETLVDSADVIGGMACDALQGTDTAFDVRIHQARPHRGQIKTAANLRRMLEGSQIRESHRNCGRVQDAYSLRCIPQVHGAVRDTLSHCREVFETEANSAVDNPLVFIPSNGGAAHVGTAHVGTGAPPVHAEHSSAVSEGEVISGGNFHGEPIAFALDFLAIALSALAGISERRIERLVNPALSEGLPPFLAPSAGLNSGFMMPQVTAAALVSENKVLAHPASVDSITTSGNKEDYVSMGMTAAIKLKRVVDNTRHVLAIEAMAAAQALDFYLHTEKPLKTSKRGQEAHAAIRAVCTTMEKDRVMYHDFARLAELIASGRLAEIVR
ncbi:MAG TPA: histidine ammonia-lyase [Candidatus Sulfotelmatobacter sp.]|nr:histidine ammonia-lyase [Candidatus Sulfotelmatobacter sp.]